MQTLNNHFHEKNTQSFPSHNNLIENKTPVRLASEKHAGSGMACEKSYKYFPFYLMSPITHCKEKLINSTLMKT